MSGLKGKIAGEILGPRPGLAIVSFWGGRIEIILRLVAALVGSLPALIAAAVALGTIQLGDDDIKDAEQLKTGIDAVDDAIDDLVDLRDNTYAATGFVIAIAGLAIIYEALIIVLRFLNIGLINIKIKIFLIIDIVITGVLAAGHFAGGVLQAFYGDEWNDYDNSDDGKTIKQSMIASAVFCFIAVGLFIVLAVFLVIYIIKGWNSKVIKATLKEAVTG